MPCATFHDETVRNVAAKRASAMKSGRSATAKEKDVDCRNGVGIVCAWRALAVPPPMLAQGTEVEVKLPGRFKVSPQIAGAIKAVPGVIQVEAL
jgi:hypothetical protein